MPNKRLIKWKKHFRNHIKSELKDSERGFDLFGNIIVWAYHLPNCGNYQNELLNIANKLQILALTNYECYSILDPLTRLNNSEFQDNVFIKYLLLIQFSFLESYNNMFDKEFYNTIRIFNKRILRNLKYNLKALNSYKSKFTKKYRNVRNNIIAHRITNAHSFIILESNINQEEILNEIINILKLSMEIVVSLSEGVILIANP